MMLGRRNTTELNCKLVYEVLINYLGCAGLNRIAQGLSIPPLTSGKFNRYANFLYDKMWPYYETIQKRAHDGIFHHYASLGIHPDSVTKQLDIAATYDGSWRKRGHTSHVCTAFVIDRGIIAGGIIADHNNVLERLSDCVEHSSQPLMMYE